MALRSKQPPPLYPPQRQSIEALAREAGESAEMALGSAKIARSRHPALRRRRASMTSAQRSPLTRTLARGVVGTMEYLTAKEPILTEWGVIPSIRVRDMKEALAFYRETLEFTLDSGGDDASNSSLTRGDAHVMIETAADLYGDEYNAAIKERLGKPSSIDLYMEASDLRAFYSRLEAAGAQIVDPLATRPWNQVQFTIEDHEGNWLTFWKRPSEAGDEAADV